MEPTPQAVPEDAKPTPTEDVVLRGLIEVAAVALVFPFAFFPPFIVAAALAHVEPAAAGWAITLIGTAAIWVTLSVRPSIRFTADEIVVRSVFGSRRVRWADISGVTLDDVTDSDSGEINHRRVNIRYRRDPDSPLPPMPTTLGGFRDWNRAHFRSVNLPLAFPPPAPDGSPRTERDSRFARRRARQRAVILRELAVRGYRLPE